MSFTVGGHAFRIASALVQSCVRIADAEGLIALPTAALRFALADRRALPLVDASRFAWLTERDDVRGHVLVVEGTSRRIALYADRMHGARDASELTRQHIERLVRVRPPALASNALVFMTETVR